MIESILGIIYFLIAISIIVVVHEFGHLIVAKRNGVKCFEFSIGMGPKIIKLGTDKSGTVYNLRAIPIGGYVMMAGEEEASEMEFDPEQSLTNKTPWQKIKILVAGATMNFILGFVILFLTFLILGVETPLDTNEVVVAEDTPIADAGVVSGDKITEVNGVATSTYEQITTAIESGDTLAITYEHNGVSKDVEVTKQQLNCEKSIIGISPQTENDRFNLPTSFKNSLTTFKALFTSVGESLVMLLNGTAGVSDLMGPVGIATSSKVVVQGGIYQMLMMLAFLTINIGIVNLLPFPALDGGRVVFAIYELITRRRFPEKFEMYLNLIGFGLLMLLFVFVTFSDVGRLGTNNYYTMTITSDSVCAQQSTNVNYNVNLDLLPDTENPNSLSVELKVSDGVVASINDQTFDTADATLDIPNDQIDDILENGIDIAVTPDSSSSKPLDLVIKISDDSGDVINQTIYRIER